MIVFDQLAASFRAKDAELSLDRVRNVAVVDARDSFIQDVDVAALASLDNIVSMNLSGCKITDDSVPHIASQSAIEFVDLGWTCCSSRELARFQNCRNLAGIGLAGMQFNRDPVELCKIQKLQFVDLEGTNVTSRFVRQLIVSTNVTEINLSGTARVPIEFADLDDLEGDSRTVTIRFGANCRIAIARPLIPT